MYNAAFFTFDLYQYNVQTINHTQFLIKRIPSSQDNSGTGKFCPKQMSARFKVVHFD